MSGHSLFFLNILLLLVVKTTKITAVDQNEKYVFNTTATTYLEAKQFCKNLGMSPLELFSKEESDEYHRIVIEKDLSGNAFWMGAERDAIDDSFRWSSNGEHIQFSHFKEGEPNNYNNIEHCTFAWVDQDIYYWNDCPCAYEGINFGAACYHPKVLRDCVVLPNYDFIYLTKALVNHYNKV